MHKSFKFNIFFYQSDKDMFFLHISIHFFLGEENNCTIVHLLKIFLIPQNTQFTYKTRVFIHFNPLSPPPSNNQHVKHLVKNDKQWWGLFFCYNNVAWKKKPSLKASPASLWWPGLVCSGRSAPPRGGSFRSAQDSTGWGPP